MQVEIATLRSKCPGKVVNPNSKRSINVKKIDTIVTKVFRSLPDLMLIQSFPLPYK